MRAHARGFTIIELMVGVSLLAFILMLGVPAFATFLQNQKVRGRAEQLQSGLQAARAAAVQLNTNVEFLLVADEPSPTTVVGAAPDTTGPHWLVRGEVFDIVTQVSTMSLIQSEHGREGSGQSDDAAITVKLAATTGSVIFTPYGNTTLAAAETIQITNPAGGACKASSGPMRCLNLMVSPGGQIRMCDPSVTTAGDTRKC